ncbi:hypothetical protein LguiB_002749 [Lonicera macranthoides]
MSIVFLAALDNVVKVLVPRPKRSRSKKQKEAEEEILVIEGIEYDREKTKKYVKFDVIVNDEDEKESAAADKTEFPGSFVDDHCDVVRSWLRAMWSRICGLPFVWIVLCVGSAIEGHWF